MATSEIQICNMALFRAGSRKTIDSLTLEGNEQAEAVACATFYEQCRDQVLSALRWPFATKFETLAPTSDVSVPGYSYAYIPPADCVVVREISPVPTASAVASESTALNRMPRSDQRVPYRVINTVKGKTVGCDLDSIQLEYTARISDVTLFPAGFVNALARLLASELAEALMAKQDIAQAQLKKYMLALEEAGAEAFREGREDVDPTSEMIAIRNGEVED
jgi:hypothetical protein